MNGKRWFQLIFVLLLTCSISAPVFALTNRPKRVSESNLSAPQSQSKPNARDMQLATGEIEPIGGDRQRQS